MPRGSGPSWEALYSRLGRASIGFLVVFVRSGAGFYRLYDGKGFIALVVISKSFGRASIRGFAVVSRRFGRASTDFIGLTVQDLLGLLGSFSLE